MVSFALVTSNGDPLSYKDATNKKHSDKMACSNVRRDGVTTEEQKLGISKIAEEKKRLLAASGYTTRKKHCQKRNVIYLCRRFTLMRMLLTC